MKKIYIKLVTGIILIHCFCYSYASVNLDEKDNQKIFNSRKSELQYSTVQNNKLTIKGTEENSKSTIFRLLSQDQSKEAVEFLENISKENEKIQLYDWFARSLFKFKFYDSAIEYFDKIARLPGISELRIFEASVNKAICRSFLGCHAMAVIDLRNLLTKKNSIPVDILFDIYMKAEEFTAKVKDLEKEYFYFIPLMPNTIVQNIETEKNFKEGYSSISNLNESSKHLLEPYITTEHIENSKKKRFLSLNLDSSSEYIYFD